jgi:hypothetical protein
MIYVLFVFVILYMYSLVNIIGNILIDFVENLNDLLLNELLIILMLNYQRIMFLYLNRFIVVELLGFMYFVIMTLYFYIFIKL